MAIQPENGLVFSYGPWNYKILYSNCERQSSVVRCIDIGEAATEIEITWKFIHESMLIGKKLSPQTIILPIETVQVKKFDRFEDIDL